MGIRRLPALFREASYRIVRSGSKPGAPVTSTWVLTHLEPVRCWFAAEDFPPTQEQDGYGLIGRGQRMSVSDYSPAPSD